MPTCAGGWAGAKPSSVWSSASSAMWRPCARAIRPTWRTLSGWRTSCRPAPRARAIAAPLLADLREAVGLRRFAGVAAKASATKSEREALPQVKQYREADGQFYFKLLAADGELLLKSEGHASPKDAGQALQRLRQSSEAELVEALAPRVSTADCQRIAAAFAALEAAEAERRSRVASA